MATARWGSARVRMPAWVLGCSWPWPLALTVAQMVTVPASRSTSFHATARASAVRQPVQAISMNVGHIGGDGQRVAVQLIEQLVGLSPVETGDAVDRASGST